MESRKTARMGLELMVLLFVINSFHWNGALAQSSNSSCTSVIISLSPCLNYITGNSKTPSASCCSQLATVVRSKPQCLCSVINGGGTALGISINRTQALTLPGACKVQTPPVSKCNSADRPTSSPASSPVRPPTSGPAPYSPTAAPYSPRSSPVAGSPPHSPRTAPSSPISPAQNRLAGVGSKKTSSNGGSSLIRMSLHLWAFLLFITLSASALNTF